MTILPRALALLASVGALLSANPAAAETLKVGKAVAKSFTFSMIDLGQKAGIFRRHGLDLEIVSFGGGARLQQAMVGESIDIGFGGGVDMAFIAKGSPILGVAAMAGPPDLVLAVRPDAGIGSIGDLKGKKVSVSSPNAVTGWMMRELLRQQGFDPAHGVTLIANAPQAGWAAMRTGQVDGIVDNYGAVRDAEQRGLGRMLTRFSDHIKDFHMYVIFASNRLIEAKPEAVRAFLRGWFETVAYARSHKAETIEVASAVTGTDKSLNETIYDFQMSIFSADGRFDGKALDTIRRSFVELKILDKEPDMATLYTEKFLPAAAGR
jgi:NitT/TauT family transport system substrate-binding protein